ncbi:hypothetical protein E5163_14755 [Marinicauda algicola]|uniref:Uncharacterized protein n=1 Tax=Marinicauda algicola TaxID=2029849 RepID=A0A4S2GW75_9PROT|nr:hypothetical protein [Marinicauda algicola]TGY87325.1 hypothetical protein E5163_14755 [Marinicauda algicola]
MTANVYPIHRAKVNAVARELRELCGIPISTLTAKLTEVWQDGYAHRMEAIRHDAVITTVDCGDPRPPIVSADPALAECIRSGQVSARQIEEHRRAGEIEDDGMITVRPNVRAPRFIDQKDPGDEQPEPPEAA